MKKIITAAAVAAALLGLAACAAPSANHQTPAGAAPASVAADKPTTSNEGFLVKKIGEKAGTTKPFSNDPFFDFWITKIAVDPKCDPYSGRKPGEHTLLIDVTVQTYTGDGELGFSEVGGIINPFAFQTKGVDDVTNPVDFSMCSTPKRLPNEYAANSKYTG